jgi:uncharacterized protein HemY
MNTPNISNFLKQPFNADMSIWGWVIFTIVILTIAFLWYTILDSFKKVA